MILRGVFWTGVYLALVLVPLLVLLMSPVPGGNGFWWDFSVALGFAGTAMMGVMFVLTARFRRATAPFGIDLIYYFHGQVALVAALFILLHPAVLLVDDPPLIRFLAPGNMPWHLWAGSGSLLAMLALVITSLWRKELGIHYDGWRIGHALLAVAALGLAIAHIEGVGYYTHASWKHRLWLLITVSWLALLAYVRLIKPAGLLRRPWEVEEIRPERGDTWTLVLRPKNHAGGMRFLPGQFAWLTLWHSPFALKEHPFSIASSAATPERLSFAIKELGDFTRRLRDVRPGQTAYLDGPHGAFSIDRVACRRPVFIAGGIGIAPIMSMLRTLADRDDRRPLLLIYAYNTLERLTFREEIESLAARLNLRLTLVLQNPPPDWQGERGFITEELLERHLPSQPEHCHYFVCGPVPMIRLVENALHRQGIPLARVHSELFDLV